MIFNLLLFTIAYQALMVAVGKDDLRNRISPRLHNFHTQYREQDKWHGDGTGGVVSWYKNHYKKDYCQSEHGYTCQRPAASVYGWEGTGIV